MKINNSNLTKKTILLCKTALSRKTVFLFASISATIIFSFGFSTDKKSIRKTLNKSEIISTIYYVDSDGDGIDDAIDLDDDNDGIVDTDECGALFCLQPIINESFETYSGSTITSWRPLREADVSGWLTTATDGRIELWTSGFLGVPASDGTILAELNANRPGALYQELCLTPGTRVRWSADHRGRAGTDVARVRIGASLASATTQQIMTSPSGSWTSYTGTYTVPIGQTTTFFMFEAVSTATGSISVGNLLDNVQITIEDSPVCPDHDGDGVPNSLDVDNDNDGIPDIVEAGGVDINGDGRVDYPIPGDPTSMVDVDNDGLWDAVDNVDSGSGAGEVTNGTPLAIIDTDGDGVLDWEDIDSDNDGIIDNVEAQTTAGFLPPSGNDTDNDGLDDRYDGDNGGTPIVPTNTDGTDNPDYKDLNSDNDNQSDNIEAYDIDRDGTSDTTLSGNDSDNDGLDDNFDVVDLATDPNNNGSNNNTSPTDFPDMDDPGGDRDWRQYIVNFELLKRDLFNDENGDGLVQAGETISYLFTVTNTGDIAITGITITDPLTAIIGGTLPTMAGGAVDNTTFTATYTITTADLVAGNVTNTATVNGTDPIGGGLTDASDDPDNIADIDTEADGEPDDPTVFLIDRFEPEIRMIKTAENLAGTINLDGATVNLGDQFNYVIRLQNIGNNNAVNIKLDDVLPVGIDYVSSSFPGTNYDMASRTININVNAARMQVGDPELLIYLTVQLSSECNDFRDTCATIIENQSFISYSGQGSSFEVLDQGSYPDLSAYNANNPGPVTVNVDLSSCTFQRDEIICNNSLTISAGAGYDNYSWSNAAGDNLGTTQSITVTSPGVYTVTKTNTPPNTCPNGTEVVNVIPFGSDPHPLAAVIGDTDIDIMTCANDGTQKYEVYLCGASDTKLLETNFVNIQSIQWQQLDASGGGCTINTSAGCATTDTGCTWNSLSTDANYEVTDAGQYRIFVIYPNGCFRFFYFDVFKNPLDPDPVVTNIICGNPGNITINAVGAGYEYSLDGGAWQNSNVFSIATAGTYDVSIRQITAIGVFACEFLEEDITVIEEDIDVNVIVTDEVCTTNGSLRIQVNGISPDYTYRISQGGVQVSFFGPTTDNDHTFPNLSPGTYDIEVTNTGGCSFTEPRTVGDYPDFSVSAAVTQNITCQDGVIEATVTGGVGPYTYSLDGGVTDQISNSFTLATAGNYTITVEDANGCIVTSNMVNLMELVVPTYTLATQNVSCNGLDNGEISVSVAATNGYTIDYSIDGGINYQNTGTFQNLPPTSYDLVVRATNGTAQCEQTQTVTITEPALLEGLAFLINPLDCRPATNDAIIEIQAISGGTPPLEYSVDGITFGSLIEFSNLGAGTYNNITIKDANDCTAVLNTIVIDPKSEPTDMDISSSALSCDAFNNYTADITVNSVTDGVPTLDNITGVAFFNYSITAGPAGVGTANITGVFNDLPVGTYTILVTDSNECTYSENYTIINTPQISLNAQKTSDVACFAASDGAFNFTVSNFTGTYDYTITGGPTVVAPANDITTATAIPITGLATGTYTITITDDVTGCTTTTDVFIDTPTAALTVNPVVTTQISCFATGNGGTATITANNGWGGYEYTITAGPVGFVVPVVQTSNTFTDLTLAGTYDVSVADANGCVVTTSFNITQAPSPTLAFDTANPAWDICYDGTNQATIVLSATGGSGSYSYNIDGGAFTPNTVYSNLGPATYTFIVRDTNGCEDTDTFTIEPQLNSVAVLTKDFDCTVTPAAQIDVTITDGYPDVGGNYLYSTD